MFNNRQEYILRSRLGKLTLDIDPMGWKDTETEIGRSEKTYGIFISESSNLKFTGKAKEFLELNLDIDGVNAKVELTKRMKHPQTDEWFIPKGFPGYLDFSTWRIEDRKFSIDFVEGGLREILTSQIREKFELDRTESISGEPITPLVTDELTTEGREIYLLSKYQERSATFTTKSGRWSSVNENRSAFHPIPITVVANSDNLNLSDPTEDYYGQERSEAPSIARMFFSTADRDRGLTRFSGSATFTVDTEDGNRINEYAHKFVLKRYTSDADGGNIVFIENLIEIPMGGIPAVGQTFTINIPETRLEPVLNDSFALGIEMIGQYGGVGTPENHDGWLNITYKDFDADFTWAEDSFFERTNAAFLTAYEVGQRETEILTGKRKFVSDLLSSENWKDLGFTCGGWIRNLQKKVEITDAQGVVIRTDLKPWPFTISFEDFYKSIHAVTPVGYGIVTKGAKQFIALENIRYFFQPYVTIRLGKVSKVKRSAADEFMFSSITTGYTKGGNYEKPLGLDEYNIQSTYTTPITKLENKYEALGTSRADSYAVEQARRMQYFLFPDEDTPYDKDNFLIDAKFLKRSNYRNYYEVRTWGDDFELPPTGVYSPETAFNLRLSPANNKHRHSQWFNAATVKFPQEKIRFASSEGNSQLETKLPGKPPVKENANTIINELSNPIFEPEWLEFEYPYTQDLLDQLQGTTEINGEQINNYYGLVEFINEAGLKERGYLFSAKGKDKFTFKLLKSYGF